MRTFCKLLGIVLSGVILILACGILYVALYFDPNDYKAELAGLGKLAKEGPSLDLDRQILPAMFIRTRQSVQAEQLKELLGATGKDFERRLLLSMSGPLNQGRHLATVMHEAEPNTERKAFWQQVREQFDDHYRRVMALLEKRYFS
jgi:hypothetical protein